MSTWFCFPLSRCLCDAHLYFINMWVLSSVPLTAQESNLLLHFLFIFRNFHTLLRGCGGGGVPISSSHCFYELFSHVERALWDFESNKIFETWRKACLWWEKSKLLKLSRILISSWSSSGKTFFHSLAEASLYLTSFASTSLNLLHIGGKSVKSSLRNSGWTFL